MEAAAPPSRAECFRSALTCAPELSVRHVFHVFPNFGIGGVPLRMCRVINYLGRQFRHTIIVRDGIFDAAKQLSPDCEFNLIDPPARKGGIIGETLSAALMMRQIGPDLLLTYNWDSIDWAIANRVLPRAPHIHFEAGFGKEEADAQIRRRVLYRRLALARSGRVIVPSRRLEQIARQVWRLPAERICYLPNGVDVERFAAPPRDALPGFTRRPGELVDGTVAPLRPEKNIGRLLRVFAMLDLPLPVRLVIAGDGAERGTLEGIARDLGLSERVIFTGWIPPEAVLGSFDIFALSSDTEQMPNAVLEAMAASLPVASVDVGDVKTMVSEKNQDFIVARGDDAAFAGTIGRLLREPATRELLGHDNRQRAVDEFSLQTMLSRYSELFFGHPGRERLYSTA